MKKFLKISTILFIVILLVTTATIVKLTVDNISDLDNDSDDFIHFTPTTTVIFSLIIVTPCYIAEYIVYKEIQYFVVRKNKKKLAIFLRLISLIFAVVVLFIYFEGFIWAWKIPISLKPEKLSTTLFKFETYALLIGIPVNLILPFVIKFIEFISEDNISDELQSGNNVGNSYTERNTEQNTPPDALSE